MAQNSVLPSDRPAEQANLRYLFRLWHFTLLDFLNPRRVIAEVPPMAKEEEFIWAVKSEGHLVTRKAGGSARDQAKQLRDEEPVRTRLARLLQVHTDERAFRVGAVGEETVGRRLAKLKLPSG